MSGQDREAVTAAFDGPFDASTFRFAPRPPSPIFAARQRVLRGVLALVLGVHVVLLLLLIRPVVPARDAASDALQVEFILVPAREAPAPPPSPRSRAQPSAAQTRTRPPVATQARPVIEAVVPSTDALQAVEIAPREPSEPPVSSARFFDDEGRIAVPKSALDDLQRNVSDDRVFDYQVAGLAKARDAFKRRPPLEYDRSRFEDGMRPDADLLSDLLSRAVEASTMSISIPIPGDQYRRIECKVVVLAAGGGCGMTGFTGYVEEDDPDTLNPEEEKQCAAWWEKITTATEQTAWLDTRALYDANCRKPKERKPAKP